MISILVVISHFFAVPSVALTGHDVMANVYNESKKKSTRSAVVDMRITDNRQRERVRYFNYVTKFSEDHEKSLIKFFRPKDIKGTGLFTQSSTDQKEKEQWVYFPALKSLKQLNASDKNKSFMGSDFTYADIAGRPLTADTHQLIKESPDYYYIESIPLDKKSDDYAKIRYVISKQYNVIANAVFYDANGEKIKTLKNTAISTINDVHVVMHSEMVNHQTAGKTVLVVQSMTVGDPVDDAVLSFQGLKTQ